METFEWVIILLLAAALLSALASRFSLPYPSLLALGGAVLAFLPMRPDWSLDPRLALTLFVAPVLLDAAYDSSPRDLLRNWRTLVGLALFAVIVSTISVAVLVKWLMPEMSWPIAIALGAIVAPPDAAAASAVLRKLPMPHRLRMVLEGESLINDASALLIYRFAVIAAVTGGMDTGSFVPELLLTVVGSVALGGCIGFLFQHVMRRFIQDVPTAVILQFVMTFGLWTLAEYLHLSGILTIVANAMIVARYGRTSTTARMRVPTFAVWETVVFVLNAFAFILIGLQIGPIWERLEPDERWSSLTTAIAVLLCVVLVRFVWVFAYSFVVRALHLDPSKRDVPAIQTIKGSAVLSWAGMRGIVTLAAAFAIPLTLADGSPFPFRDLILLCAFVTVQGTLVVQGLTLGPLILALRLPSDDPVALEVSRARVEAYAAGLAAIASDSSAEAEQVRREYQMRQIPIATEVKPLEQLPGNAQRRTLLAAARAKSDELRISGQIGDEAFRMLEAELDWAELGAGGLR